MIKRDKYLNKLIKAKGDGWSLSNYRYKKMWEILLLKNLFSNYLIENGVNKEQIFILKLCDDKNDFLRNPIELEKYIREIKKIIK